MGTNMDLHVCTLAFLSDSRALKSAKADYSTDLGRSFPVAWNFHVSISSAMRGLPCTTPVCHLLVLNLFRICSDTLIVRAFDILLRSWSILVSTIHIGVATWSHTTKAGCHSIDFSLFVVDNLHALLLIHSSTIPRGLQTDRCQCQIWCPSPILPTSLHPTP